MSNKDETIMNESQEQKKQPETAVEILEDVVGSQEAEVANSIKDVEWAGETEVSEIKEEGGLSEDVVEITEVVKETTEEAEEAKEEYEEQLKNIPNAGDKVEAIKKETEASEEYNEKLKDIPNANDLAESFTKKESVEEVVEEVETEESPVKKATDTNDSSYFPGNRFVNKESSKVEETKAEESSGEKELRRKKVAEELETTGAVNIMGDPLFPNSNNGTEELKEKAPTKNNSSHSLGNRSVNRESPEEDGKVDSIEEIGNLPNDTEEVKEVVKETTEEAEEAKEEYYEELKSNIPNFDDKAEAIKKEVEVNEEAKEEYEEKLKDIPNESDLAKSFKTESVEDVIEETEEDAKEKKKRIDICCEEWKSNGEKLKTAENGSKTFKILRIIGETVHLKNTKEGDNIKSSNIKKEFLYEYNKK